jgi:hypothetical protein
MTDAPVTKCYQVKVILWNRRDNNGQSYSIDFQGSPGSQQGYQPPKLQGCDVWVSGNETSLCRHRSLERFLLEGLADRQVDSREQNGHKTVMSCEHV